MRKPKLLSDRQMHMYRGKALVGALTREEQLQVVEHLNLIEMKLDEKDDEDFFGTEGWRHHFGIPE